MFIHILLGVGNVEFRVRAFCLPIESLGVNLTDSSAKTNCLGPVIRAAALLQPELHKLRRAKESARIYSYEGPAAAGRRRQSRKKKKREQQPQWQIKKERKKIRAANFL